MSKTKRQLPEWNRQVKKALVDRNLKVKELAELVGYSNTYTSNVVNGTIVGATKIEAKINDVLEINKAKEALQ